MKLANKSETVVLRGKAMYAKILGDPIQNYNKDGLEWKLDLIIDKAVVKELKGYGIGDRVKTKEDYIEGRPYLSFKHRELTKTGKENKPIKVENLIGEPWDQEVLIGNGSTIDVKFDIVDYGPGMKNGVYIRSVRVLDLVPYVQGSAMKELSEDDEYFAKAAALRAEKEARKNEEDRQFKEDFGLDDDVDDIGAEDEVV